MPEISDYPGLRRRRTSNSNNNIIMNDTLDAASDQDQQTSTARTATIRPIGSRNEMMEQAIPTVAAAVRIEPNGQIPNNNVSQRQRGKSSHMYVLFSTCIAFLAIISPPTRRNMQSRVQVPSSNAETKYLVRNGHSVVLTDEIMNSVERRSKAFGSGGGADDQYFSRYTKEYGKGGFDQFASVEQVARAAATAALSDLVPKEKPSLLKYYQNAYNSEGENIQSQHQGCAVSTAEEVSDELHQNPMSNLFGKKKQPASASSTATTSTSSRDEKTSYNNNDNGLPPPLKWVFSKLKKNIKNKPENENEITKNNNDQPLALSFRILAKFIDPSLLQSLNKSQNRHDSESNTSGQSKRSSRSRSSEWARTATHILDKIIHSTPRLIAITNLLLAGTYLIHSAVADYFLGEAHTATGDNTANFGGGGNASMMEISGVGASASNRIHRSGRERLGGYLLFKLLLIYAVVEPDTLDLLILLSWYTLLSFLKSLSFLAGITTSHASASGQVPQRGILRLLLLVLVCDISAAATCAALFHSAGWGMVVLLTCDCSLLALDIFTHLARFLQLLLVERHHLALAEIEQRQIHLHEQRRSTGNNDESESARGLEENEERAFEEMIESHMDNETRSQDENIGADQLRMLSRELDHEMELLETINSRRLANLDNIAFMLELFGLLITTSHFIHIWTLHGITFNLVDGVLALHLHSAISAIGKKISERRNHNRIARDLNKFFEDATEIELKKACVAGDVCCICLGTMSMGNVKKVGCGHLYHTNCLREVVERARSIEAARCPLCRQSILDGSHIPSSQPTGIPQPFIFGGLQANNQDRNVPVNPMNNTGTPLNAQQDETNRNMNAAGQDGDNRAANIAHNQNERALFRFSTEGILPSWLPLPAFSFEVVRRPPSGIEVGGDAVPPQMQQPAPQQQQPPQQGIGNNININTIAQQNQQQEQQQSFWRRLLVLTGAIPMSPEEEAAAIAQLVDMFPQYERADLLRELRERGSAEAVVESIITGVFSGIDRGGTVDDNQDDGAGQASN